MQVNKHKNLSKFNKPFSFGRSKFKKPNFLNIHLFGDFGWKLHALQINDNEWWGVTLALP